MYTGEWLKTPALSMCEPATRGIWIDLCCAIWDADDEGSITGTVSQLSRVCRCDVQEMRAAIDDLVENDVADIGSCEDGFFTITSRRMRKQLAEMHGNRDRQRKHRSRNADSNGEVTGDVTQLSEEGRLKTEEGRRKVSSAEEKVSESFEIVWATYEKKIGKDAARKAWKSRTKTERVAIMEHIPRFVAATPEKKFRPHLSTYLNRRQWEDEELPINTNGKAQNNRGLTASQVSSLSIDETLRMGGWAEGELQQDTGGQGDHRARLTDGSHNGQATVLVTGRRTGTPKLDE